MKIENYLIDNQRFIPPPRTGRRGIVRLLLFAIVAFCLCGCASGDESDFCDNDAEASSVADGEVGLLVPTLKDVGLWNVDGILRNIGGKTCDVAWQGMTARFSEAKAEFYCECIAYGTESGTETRLLGEYDAVYDENNILYLGGEKFEVSRADGGGLTLISSATIIKLSH